MEKQTSPIFKKRKLAQNGEEVKLRREKELQGDNNFSSNLFSTLSFIKKEETPQNILVEWSLKPFTASKADVPINYCIQIFKHDQMGGDYELEVGMKKERVISCFAKENPSKPEQLVIMQRVWKADYQFSEAGNRFKLNPFFLDFGERFVEFAKKIEDDLNNRNEEGLLFLQQQIRV